MIQSAPVRGWTEVLHSEDLRAPGGPGGTVQMTAEACGTLVALWIGHSDGGPGSSVSCCEVWWPHLFSHRSSNTSAAHSLLIKIPLFYLSSAGGGEHITEGSLATVFGLIAGQITTRKNAH